jgi:small-conductance mechanosensitive channel
LTEETAKRSVIQHPILSAFVIALNILQFIFVDPPFAFNALLWIISSVTLIIIARRQIPKYWMIAWYVMFGLFLFACANNLILQASRPERWMMLGLSIAGVLGGTVIILTEPKNELREKIIIYFVAFLIIMQLISIFTNINGRYNFAKTSLTSGYFNIIIAILFFWTIRLINEGLSLASKAYKVPGKKLFRINFDRIGNKAPRIFYVLLVIGWFVLFARNFYAHKIISEPIKDFVYRERIIGEFSFTIGSMLLFFLILYLTSFISRLVSFFALDSQNKTNDSGSRKSGLGSWILVVRISIIVIGFLLALAAIGLPMDRLTIVLSALGVGIGFGLQTLVNNLVSGLIISFEKPVSVGDIVEVSGQLGTIKSIGFRSSIISSGNGSDVIIPNGDLLNRHLVNWSRDGNSKSVDIITTVAHGTDLEKTIRILKAIPANDKRVLSKPEPSVLIKDFNAQGIDMQLSLRVENIQEVARVKSDMILAIDAAFRENGIEVPVSRQSVTIQSKEK